MTAPPPSAQLGRRPRAGGGAAHVTAVQQWARTRFRLPADSPVGVAEVRCTVPGCPPLETALSFWSEDGRRHQVRLLKEVAAVERSDIAWLIGSLDDHDGGVWECC